MHTPNMIHFLKMCFFTIPKTDLSTSFRHHECAPCTPCCKHACILERRAGRVPKHTTSRLFRISARNFSGLFILYAPSPRLPCKSSAYARTLVRTHSHTCKRLLNLRPGGALRSHSAAPLPSAHHMPRVPPIYLATFKSCTSPCTAPNW